MTARTISEKQANIILAIFCILHVMLLSFSSELFRSSVTHDSLEGIAWGYQWQLGYSKHPFVAAWLTAIATKLAQGYVGLPVYILSQLAVITAFIANYKLAKKILPIPQALISVLLLEGIIYFNIHSINFTPDTAQTPFWALTALVFYNALSTQKFINWFFTALLLALSILTKYSAIFLILPMLMVCLFTKVGRKSFYNKYFYLAVIIFILLLTPHLHWAYEQGFTGVSYINSTLDHSKDGFIKHLYYPFAYVKGQALIATGMLVLAWPLWLSKKGFKNLVSNSISIRLKNSIPLLLSKKGLKNSTSKILKNSIYKNINQTANITENTNINQNTDVNQTSKTDLHTTIVGFNKNYILIMGLSPILITVLYAAISGNHILQRWSTPYYYIAGITFMILINPIITKEKIIKTVKTAFIALFFICFMRSSYFTWWPEITNNFSADAYLPNKEIATKVTEIWHKNFNSKLKYVAGSHYLCAFIAAYSKDKPKPYFSVSMIDAPWIKEENLLQDGAIFAWEVTDLSSQDAQDLPQHIKNKYPTLKNLGVFKFKKRVKQNKDLQVSETVDILIAILPPQK